MSSIWNAPLANGKKWYVGSWVSGNGVADIIIPIAQLDGMSNEEIGAYVRSAENLAMECHIAELRYEKKLQDERNKQQRHRKPNANKSKPGYIYLLFAENTSWYKVGQTKNISNRIRQLSTKAPYEILHLKSYSVKDMNEAESYWHKRFDGKRVNGEWFVLDEADVNDFMTWNGTCHE